MQFHQSTLNVDKPVLVNGAPIAFVRRIPCIIPGLRFYGWNVRVEISAQHRILVHLLTSDRTMLTGRYAKGRVTWDQEPSEELPRAVHKLLAADVLGALNLLRRSVKPSKA